MNLSKLKSNIKKGNLDLEEMDLKSVFFGMSCFFVAPDCHYSCSSGCTLAGVSNLNKCATSCVDGCSGGCSSSLCTTCVSGQSRN